MIRDPGMSLHEKRSSGLAVTVLTACALCHISMPIAADPQGGSVGYDRPPPAAAHAASPLELMMESIVSVEAITSTEARTSKNFGVTRSGSGVVLDADGLVVTAGYLVAEAESVSLTLNDGTRHSAEVIAYDNVTGLGLIRALGNVTTVPIGIGDSEATEVGDLAMIIPAAGESEAKAVKVGKIKKYSGGWEYIVYNALHTYPPSTHFSGAALVSDSAELLGIGGLVTIDIDIDPKVRVPGNIFVPVNSLMSVIGQLLVEGRSAGSKRPWIGLDTKKTKRGVAVSSLENDAPAKNAGLRSGDILVAVAKQQVKNQIDFYEKIWKAVAPGESIDILVLRGDEYRSISVDTVDYYDWLRLPAQKTQLSELSE